MMRFRDRHDAGRRLAALLESYRAVDPIVVGLPRGGVVVAAEVARALQAPLDVVIVRKLGVPWQPELAMGAVGECGVQVMNDSVVESLNVGPDEIETVVRKEVAELERRAAVYRGGRAPLAVEGRTVLLVDDGLATGATALAATRVLRVLGAAAIVLAVPVGAPDSIATVAREVDAVVAVQQPAHLTSIGMWYDNFDATSDAEVIKLLETGGSDAPFD